MKLTEKQTDQVYKILTDFVFNQGYYESDFIRDLESILTEQPQPDIMDLTDMD